MRFDCVARPKVCGKGDRASERVAAGCEGSKGRGDGDSDGDGGGGDGGGGGSGLGAGELGASGGGRLFGTALVERRPDEQEHGDRAGGKKSEKGVLSGWTMRLERSLAWVLVEKPAGWAVHCEYVRGALYGLSGERAARRWRDSVDTGRGAEPDSHRSSGGLLVG